jgi:hypothetical protein
LSDIFWQDWLARKRYKFYEERLATLKCRKLNMIIISYCCFSGPQIINGKILDYYLFIHIKKELRHEIHVVYPHKKG